MILRAMFVLQLLDKSKNQCSTPITINHNVVPKVNYAYVNIICFFFKVCNMYIVL